MRQFKITYLLQSKYKIKLAGAVVAWKDGQLEILDRNKRVHSIREEQIIAIIAQQPAMIEKKPRAQQDPFEQQELF